VTIAAAVLVVGPLTDGADARAVRSGQAPTIAPTDVGPFDLATVRPIDTPDIDPVLDGVDVVEGSEIDRAEAELVRRVAAQDDATIAWIEAERRRADMVTKAGSAVQRAADAQRTLSERVVAQAELQTRLEQLQLTEDVLRARLAEEQDLLRGLAAEAITAGTDDTYALLGSLDDWTEADRRTASWDRAIELQSDDVELHRAPWAEARGQRRDFTARVDEARRATADAQDEVARTTDERDRFDEVLAAISEDSRKARAVLDAAADASRDAIVARRAARLESRVADQDLALVALHAYWRASALAPCSVPWWVLAGIGRVETHHATAQGAELTASGDTTVQIRGIPLDGRPGVAAIGDTDGGRYDGDGTWDRAVGPMQFIPGTWARWAADGNGDDEADPHNIYDTALAAARYLCFGRGPLTDEAAIRRALLSYNRSVPYGTKVLSYGEGYRDALDDLPDLGELPEGASAGSGQASTTDD
jgi:membrane-bound lytic murein transglycosylase B